METVFQRTTSQLVESYSGLSDFEKIVLQQCCVFAEPATDEIIAGCLMDFFANHKSVQQDLIQNVERALIKLKDLHFLTAANTCDESFIEIACRHALKKGFFQKMAAVVNYNFPTTEAYLTKNKTTAHKRFWRDLRIDIYNSDIDRFNSDLLSFLSFPGLDSMPNPVAAICNTPFDAEWFSGLHLQIQLYALNEIHKDSIRHLKPLTSILHFLEKQANRYKIPYNAKKSFAYVLTTQLILAGNSVKARKIITRHKKLVSSLGLKGLLLFLEGLNDKALSCYESDLHTLRQANEDENSYFTGVEGLFYIVAMLKTGNFSYLEIAEHVVNTIEKIQPHNLFKEAYTSLRFVIHALENRLNLKTFHQHLRSISPEDSISVLFAALAAHWIKGEIPENILDAVDDSFIKSDENGYKWLALEYAKLLEMSLRDKEKRKNSSRFQKETGFIPSTSAVTFEEPWQRALKALLQSTSPEFEKEPGTHEMRLAWYISYNDETRELSLLPKEQKKSVKNAWTGGRSISLKKLFAGDYPAYFKSQDKKICAAIKLKENPWGTSFYFDPDQAFPALVGHPGLFLEGKAEEPVEIIKGAPQLRVKEKEGIFQLRFFPEISEKKVVLIKESAKCFKVYEILDGHRRVAYIIGEKGLNVPAEAKDEVLAVLGNVSSFMTVHSDIHGKTDITNEVVADSKIYVHLNPYSSGLRLSLFVKPLSRGGPYLKPGMGAENVIAEIDGQKIQTRRDLVLEKKNLLHVEDECPTLSLYDKMDMEWAILTPEDCLEVLLQLQRLGDEIAIEWPEGEKFTVSRQITTDQFHVRIHKKNNWFQVDGELVLDDDLVLDMHKLLELTQTTSSRFIPIGEGQFLALTKELRKQIDELSLYSEQKGKKLRVSQFSAVALNDFSHSGIHLEADSNWEEQIKRLNAAEKFQPVLPTTFKAELREYQIDGYNWLARMAYWGVGACLADDMGLGKTIQALALILDRAPVGPTLVVAPTSVCLNWKNEANRFAPTLNVKLFTGKQRKKLINNLQPLDVIIVSYALLQQESDILARINWQTIVLDEAQAIKNMATKRSRAAMSLQGNFKLITTGTPIENHLGELWNLYNFINPGLLGSYRQFTNRFINPITRHQNRTIRKKLKKLIGPFILRRIKSQVLDELPPRTEVTLQVEMGPGEAALYEALRQQALDKIKANESPGKKHLTILAQITRLRRMCCNPRLVVPETTIKSSKLSLFSEIITELLDNNHKALVFSQFVAHLKILRDFLNLHKISYRYIDGGTPAKQRQKEVDLFQAGQGDVFLISLKAGGLGLNLTAADYVIHMDPWWNPAVEDQASDRAHRIGQIHPVTIYRLVTRNTIEEKIIALHQDKRELADSLLEGADIKSKISADELLNLLQGQ